MYSSYEKSLEIFLRWIWEDWDIVVNDSAILMFEIQQSNSNFDRRLSRKDNMLHIQYSARNCKKKKYLTLMTIHEILSFSSI